MVKNKNSSEKNLSSNQFRQFIRKNGLLILMAAFVVALLIIPDAKSVVLRQLIRTGLFNSSIGMSSPDVLSQFEIDFDFADESGTVQNVSSLRGKVVFINFWAS